MLVYNSDTIIYNIDTQQWYITEMRITQRYMIIGITLDHLPSPVAWLRSNGLQLL